MAVSAAEEGKQSKEAEQEGDHRAGIFSGSAQPDQSLGTGRSFGEGQDMNIVIQAMAPDLEARRPLAKRSSGDWNSSAGKVEGQLPLLIRKVGRRSTHAA